MKKCISLSLIIPIAAIATLSVSCKPSPETVDSESTTTINEQMDKAQSVAIEATEDLKAYTYAQKKEFVAAMEKQVADLNRRLDELDANVAKASTKVKMEAKPKMAALRARADLLNEQLGAAKNATSSTWENVKTTTSKAYDELSESFNEARDWVSEKIAS